ncbi:hypothetical protein JYU34_020340 [Plutella xylostella]|uniref:Uncharacterized protein n=1 Tax=Plutella xylostella TaxID=51655 RepID=A0ABQ7PUA6_PLUXY|nr:hypothetical protein JYU34_020340 [Plutella xylostella]
MVLIKILILVILTTTVSCNDLLLGEKWGGKLIFNETFEANPALWTREEKVFVDAKRNIVNKIVVEDHRPNKDGVASVIDGGINFNNVTIHLESPSIFRGYSFSVKVYAVNKTAIPSFVTTRKPGNAIATRLPVLSTSKAPDSSTSNSVTISSTTKEASTTTKMPSTTVSSTSKPHVSSTTNSETISTTKLPSTATRIPSTTSPSVNTSSAKTNEILSSIASRSPTTSTSNSVTKVPITTVNWCKLFGCVFHDSRGTNEEPSTTEDTNGLKAKHNSSKNVFDSRKKELQEDYELELITDRIY